MKYLVISLALLGAATSAQAFDTKKCANISDVQVPYEVTIAETTIQFRGSGGDITVTPTVISSGARQYSGALAGGYYDKLRQFLAGATKMAKAANPFAGGISTMGSTATDMCRAILDMEVSNKAVEREFEGFASPVRIVLR